FPARTAATTAPQYGQQSHDRVHLALELGGSTVDRLIRRVFRVQPHAVGLAEEPLDGGRGLVGLVVFQPGDNDAAIGRIFAGADHDKITGEDADVLHAVAMDLEGEGRVRADQFLAEDQVILDVLFGEDRLAGSDAAHQGDRNDLAEFGLHFVDVDDFDGARLGRIAPDVALPLQSVEVVLNRGAGGESDRFANFANGRRVTADLLSKPKVPQDLPLPAGQRLRHI